MKLTPLLADRYASYRDRYLGGPLGTYEGFPGDVTDPCSGSQANRLRVGDPVPFLRLGDPMAPAQNTFLHIDRMEIEHRDNPQDLESAPVAKIHHGDNLIYASLAMLNFVCEYQLTGIEQSLKIALGIARSFQRLGSYQNGLSETGQGPYGFMLRLDSPDDADPGDNICAFGAGGGPSALGLAPSQDQYCIFFSSLAHALTVLDQTQVPPEHAVQAEALRSTIQERISRCSNFLAQQTLYTIRWVHGHDVLQPNDERGPYCHHIAYPVARIAARALTPDHDPAKFGQFLGNLSFALIKDITIVLNQLIAQALRDSIPKFIKDRFVSFAKDTLIGQVWNEIADLINIAGKIEEFFNDKVLNPVLTRIVEPLVQKLSAWNGNPVIQAVNEFLARKTFELYSVGCLLDTSDDRKSPPRFGDLTLSLPQLLGLIGQVNLPDRFEINADLNFEALNPPSWWKSPPLPSWDPLRWSFHVGVFSFDLSGLIVGISLNDLLRKLAALGKAKPQIRLHAFMLNSAADTFGETQIDPLRMAIKYDNTLYAALAHRFHRVPDQDADLKALLGILESVPEGFPKGKGTAPWNQDFRWLRDPETKDDNVLYGGLDFMLPLLLAASASDIATNREILLTALSTKTDTEETMGPFKLPFQGPASNVPVFEPKAGGTQKETTLYVGVVFDRTAGTGKVTLTVPKLDGSTEDVDFEQAKPCHMIAVPLMQQGIIIKNITSQSKGYILISTSD